MSVLASIRCLFQRVAEYVSPSSYGLCPPSQLEEVIRRERSRADRTGGQFAVVSFFNGSGSRDRRLLLPLVTHLQRRSRSIDDLGWSQDNKLWLILTNCTEEAAANLATQHCCSFSRADLKLEFNLYHYAADSARRPKPPTKVEDEVQRIVGTINSPTASGQSEIPTLALEAEGTAVNNAQISLAQPIERLLVRRMPWWKRTLDIVVSAAALLLLSPLFAFIAIIVKWSSPGPVLFKQLRTGCGGQPFLLYKFRSMVIDAESQKQTLLALNEQDGPAFKMERDPRVTRIGRVLRALSIDELPQLWNVLRGDMSLVGPRPLPIHEAEACSDWQRQRTDVTPGLTCFWQVKDRRSKIPFVEWARMDIRYIRGRSLWVDLRLMAQTLLFVIRRKGI